MMRIAEFGLMKSVTGKLGLSDFFYHWHSLSSFLSQALDLDVNIKQAYLYKTSLVCEEDIVPKMNFFFHY